MRKTFKYRIYPKPHQAELIERTLELCRFLYNCALEHRIRAYKHSQQSISQYAQMSELPGIKAEIAEYREVHSQVLQEVIKKLDRSFDNFFRRIREGDPKPGFPRYQGVNRYDSFVYPQLGNKMLPAQGRIYLPKIGSVKIKLSRSLEGTPKTCTIIHKNGKYYACFSCEVEKKSLQATGKVAGLDMGVISFVATSDGENIEAPKTYRKAENKLKRAQREVSRRNRGSNRRRKSVINLARLHEKVANQRRDIAHKTARKLVNEYDLIAYEDLQIKNMVKNRHLAKSIQDAGWNLFFNILTSKAEEAGRRIVKVSPAYTSQICSECGELVKKTLAERTHHCPVCGLILDRDVNAARNILKIALAQTSMKNKGSGRAFGDVAALAAASEPRISLVFSQGV